MMSRAANRRQFLQGAVAAGAALSSGELSVLSGLPPVSAADLAADLERWKSGFPVGARRVGAAGHAVRILGAGADEDRGAGADRG